MKTEIKKYALFVKNKNEYLADSYSYSPELTTKKKPKFIIQKETAYTKKAILELQYPDCEIEIREFIEVIEDVPEFEENKIIIEHLKNITNFYSDNSKITNNFKYFNFPSGRIISLLTNNKHKYLIFLYLDHYKCDFKGYDKILKIAELKSHIKEIKIKPRSKMVNVDFRNFSHAICFSCNSIGSASVLKLIGKETGISIDVYDIIEKSFK